MIITAALSASASHIVKRHLSIILTLIFSLLLIIYYLILAPTGVNAQACTPAGPQSTRDSINQLNKCAIEKDIFDDKIFNINQISGTSDSLFNLLTGRSQLHPETNAATDGGGALAASGKMVAALYSSPPASGVYYFASVFHKFNPVQPTYAQTGTIGYDALAPVKTVWTAFRNFSYVGFVIVFVIIGFMIMLR